MSNEREVDGLVEEKTERLSTVQMGILCVWLTLAIDLAAAVANRWLGSYSKGQTAATILLCALYAIIPYKLQMRSNVARYLYAVINAIGLAFFAAGVYVGMSKLDRFMNIVSLPLVVWSVYALFSKSGNEWFSKRLA